jgi:hypothetical protein
LCKFNLLQDDELYYAGSGAAWRRWGRDRFQVSAGGDEAVHDSGPEPQHALHRPGLSTTDTAISTHISFAVEVRRKEQAVVLMIIGGLFTVVFYLISRRFDMGGALSITLSILLILSIGVVALNAFLLLASILRLRDFTWRVKTYSTCVRWDLRQRGLAFADEKTAFRNLTESLCRVPIGPVNDETLATLEAMEREEAISYYMQWGELKQSQSSYGREREIDSGSGHTPA